MKKTISATGGFILLFIVFSVLSTPKPSEMPAAIADQAPRVWILSSFEGLNSQINEFSAPDNKAHAVSNVRFNNRFGSLGKREALLTELDFGSGSVNGLHRYYKSDGTIKTIAAIGTTLVSDFSGTATSIKTGLTDGKRWQFSTYKDVAIGTNGYDANLKYDGHTTTTANTDNARTAGDLCAELGAPFAQLSSENGGNDLDASSWYLYKVAFYDGTDYTYSTARSNPILTGSTVQNITLTNVPIGPSGTTHRYVYRTLGNASRTAVLADTTYYLVKDLADNTTQTFDDAMTDATADDGAAPTWATASAGVNVTPPTGTLNEIHRERLFIAGNTTYQSDVYWSDDGNPDYFDPVDYTPVRIDDGDKITFIKSFLGALVTGKTNTIQKFYTDGDVTTDWYMSGVSSTVGCPAGYSASISPLGVIYLGRAGIYSFNGDSSQLISDAVTPQIRDISQTNIADCAGIYHNNEYRLAYTSETTGSAYNDRALVFDFTRDAYSLDYENIKCFCSFGSGTDYGVLYSGSSTSDGYVFAHNGSPISLSKRYKSQFDDTSATYDDVRSYGTEESPILELGWDCTISGWTGELQAKNASIDTLAAIKTYLPDATIARPDTGGSWTSGVYDVNASNFDKIYWNENLGSYGDITFQVRTGNTSTVDGTWTAYCTAVSNPSGSDISSVTAGRYIQVKINFSTTDVDYSPTLYLADNFLFSVAYSKVGTAYETSVLSVYETGWKDFQLPIYKKNIKRIRVFYEGTAGTLSVNFKNGEGDIDRTFNIDLSVNPNTSSSDEYTGTGTTKIFTYYTPINSDTSPSPIGQFWKFTLTENGITNWTVSRIEVEFIPEELYD